MKDDRTLAVEMRVMSMLEARNVAPKMLIAAADPCFVRALAERCSRMGFDVETAAGDSRALIKASQRRPDILVIDLHMPEVDGLAVCAHLSAPETKSINVIVMTGHSSPEMAERCEGFGASYTHKGQQFLGRVRDSPARILPRTGIWHKAGGQTPRSAYTPRARLGG
jgi:CheY-like chemotaxis protein